MWTPWKLRGKSAPGLLPRYVTLEDKNVYQRSKKSLMHVHKQVSGRNKSNGCLAHQPFNYEVNMSVRCLGGIAQWSLCQTPELRGGGFKSPSSYYVSGLKALVCCCVNLKMYLIVFDSVSLKKNNSLKYIHTSESIATLHAYRYICATAALS
jgi:hypothetical protein